MNDLPHPSSPPHPSRTPMFRSFLTRQRLKRAAIRAKEQAATVAYLILRAQALASANSIIDLVLAQVPALVAQRKSARKQAAMVRRAAVHVLCQVVGTIPPWQRLTSGPTLPLLRAWGCYRPAEHVADAAVRCGAEAARTWCSTQAAGHQPPEEELEQAHRRRRASPRLPHPAHVTPHDAQDHEAWHRQGQDLDHQQGASVLPNPVRSRPLSAPPHRGRSLVA